MKIRLTVCQDPDTHVPILRDRTPPVDTLGAGLTAVFELRLDVEGLRVDAAGIQESFVHRLYNSMRGFALFLHRRWWTGLGLRVRRSLSIHFIFRYCFPIPHVTEHYRELLYVNISIIFPQLVSLIYTCPQRPTDQRYRVLQYLDKQASTLLGLVVELHFSSGNLRMPLLQYTVLERIPRPHDLLHCNETP